MKNEIKIFENEEFGKVRTVVVDGEPWFVGRDITEILEYSNSRKAIADHVDTEDKGVTKCDTPGGKQSLTIINESGLYSLILSSKLPRAKDFKRWIMSEVLPTIRKTGGYVSNADMFVDNYLSFVDEPVRNLFKLQFQCINQLQKRIEHDKPLVEFAEQVSDTSNLIDMNKMAKLANCREIPIGRNGLFGFLRKMKILMMNNVPYQRYIDRGYFTVKESVFEVGTLKKTCQQTFVTGKGQRYIIGLLKKYYGKGEV